MANKIIRNPSFEAELKKISKKIYFQLQAELLLAKIKEINKHQN